MANSETRPFQYLIAGPCAAETEEQVYETAHQLSVQNFPVPLTFFRCGVWKPRSKADSFCGAGEPAFSWLRRVRDDFGFKVCVEVASPKHVETCLKNGVRCMWVGARTAVNPFAVQEIAEAVKGEEVAVMVKNPAIPDLQLWIGNIERFEKSGCTQIFAVHRGFAEQSENVLRNAPLWEIPVALRVARPDIPLICDPSHIAGHRDYVKSIAQVAIDYGCNGLMLETHCNPAAALSDARQQFTPADLLDLFSSLVFKKSVADSDDLLRQQRALIRNIDIQVSQLLSKRLSVVEEIARIKKSHDIPLVQPSQWNQVVELYEQNALKDECYQEFLKKFLHLLHQYSLKMQQNIDE